ncbi:UDP-N-acetylglucosamine 2-epimerase (hydrolyzing) [Salmonella enterica]|uniref:UDP-N-acetylglucosamine 2-epimerase (Hydrolyzing) n=1 Tax=Salmonella enterica subsp. salamae serovar 48:d:z6 TaxID=1151170 RepID=A0A701VDX5_SALER|nr:UDP-N-acetylglucosamine 2-epimerase [Salmonella enterica]ECC1627276.1 UDP-N-acetylglucosamine 2-epimerase (hydrolyzing) [Salmonella enterica subsp. salamae]EAO6764285.1 UDP-N-acetylglucosamine 2-epimerase (hydrolyzing) [Salmonella enterica]EBQ1375142.1 UDP-N-acetylglucosamine 2-epimerase (hydrolyzing) [Salmonella enterica]ECH2416155.1 UDP-N-acetylglucosamine 2-epimerase (hydrolyzing) [Salmonella enterica]ECI4105453.1 UDP-N-acetylglucosamine 2-epimerase (hydrolyzing) [Salmonella enterica sub
MKKKLLYVTGSRAEYGIMKRLLKSLNDDPNIDLSIIATGMHCDPEYGCTYKTIEQDGFSIEKLVDLKLENKTNAGILKSMSICQEAFGEYFQEHKYDAVIILGDRYEIFSVAVAAAMHNLPIIHLHGGEKTLGNYDEFIRHSITKMSRLHLVSTDEYRRRVIQLGEEPEFVFNVGALGAENSFLLDLPDKVELEKKLGKLDRAYFVVVFHPETLSTLPVNEQYLELLGALSDFSQEYDYIFIGSNADTGSEQIKEMTLDFCREYGCRYIVSMRTEEYLALVKCSCGLIGNSSSGLIEVPSLKVPTINIGDRQKGRVRGYSVIDTICKKENIISAIVSSRKECFINRLQCETNPYYNKDVNKNITKIIKTFLNIDCDKLGYKDFYDIYI